MLEYHNLTMSSDREFLLQQEPVAIEAGSTAIQVRHFSVAHQSTSYIVCIANKTKRSFMGCFAMLSARSFILPQVMHWAVPIWELHCRTDSECLGRTANHSVQAIAIRSLESGSCADNSSGSGFLAESTKRDIGSELTPVGNQEHLGHILDSVGVGR